MKKMLLILLLFIVSINQPAFAEKISVKVSPTQIISTNNDEIEVGDWIKFKIVNDVKKNDILYLKKGTKIIGVVDFVHPNGWLADAADIKLVNFSTVDVNNKSVKIIYPLNINGNTPMLRNTKQYILKALLVIFRGSEIYVEPSTTVYNIFITS